MNINTIFNRVANWNAERYPRIYNRQLTISLLNEENQEFKDALTDVDILDASCDIIYVAMGGLWKLGIDRLCLTSFLKLDVWLNAMQNNDDIDFALLRGVILSALSDMADMGLSDKQTLMVLSVVCDSNDSKTAKMTAPSIKASVDKGEDFIRPEPRLRKVLDGVELWKI